jgi:hypothetical protein
LDGNYDLTKEDVIDDGDGNTKNEDINIEELITVSWKADSKVKFIGFYSKNEKSILQ